MNRINCCVVGVKFCTEYTASTRQRQQGLIHRFIGITIIILIVIFIAQTDRFDIPSNNRLEWLIKLAVGKFAALRSEPILILPGSFQVVFRKSILRSMADFIFIFVRLIWIYHTYDMPNTRRPLLDSFKLRASFWEDGSA